MLLVLFEATFQCDQDNHNCRDGNHDDHDGFVSGILWRDGHDLNGLLLSAVILLAITFLVFYEWGIHAQMFLNADGDLRTGIGHCRGSGISPSVSVPRAGWWSRADVNAVWAFRPGRM